MGEEATYEILELTPYEKQLQEFNQNIVLHAFFGGILALKAIFDYNIVFTEQELNLFSAGVLTLAIGETVLSLGSFKKMLHEIARKISFKHHNNNVVTESDNKQEENEEILVRSMKP